MKTMQNVQIHLWYNTKYNIYHCSFGSATPDWYEDSYREGYEVFSVSGIHQFKDVFFNGCKVYSVDGGHPQIVNEWANNPIEGFHGMSPWLVKDGDRLFLVTFP